MEWQLLESPPADRLLALYFISNNFWERPSRTAFASGGNDAESGIWECPFPDQTE